MDRELEDAKRELRAKQSEIEDLRSKYDES